MERRVDSLLSEMNFGLVSLGEHGDAADKFASHFAETVTFSGSESPLFESEEGRAALRKLYLEYRTFAKSSSAERIGDTQVTVADSTTAEVATTVAFRLTFHGTDGGDQRELPVVLTFEKLAGDWLISKVEMQGKALEDVDF